MVRWFFADKLGETLVKTVRIRNRFLVYSSESECFNCKGWQDFDYTAADLKNVYLWTKEMMQPTISALDQNQKKAPHKITNLALSGMDETQTRIRAIADVE
jgi:hypothetical protein